MFIFNLRGDKKLGQLVNGIAEREIIGACMKELNLIDNKSIILDDFTWTQSHYVAEVLFDFRRKGATSVDPVDVLNELKNKDEAIFEVLQKSYDIEQWVTLTYQTGNFDNFQYNWNELKKCTILRNLYQNGINLDEFFPFNELVLDNFEKFKKMKIAFNNMTPEDLINAIQEKYVNVVDNSKRITKVTYINPFIGYKDTELPDFKQEILIEDLFLTTTFNTIAAPPKMGKSQLAYQMCFCLQNGIDFLNRKVKKSNVLYLDFEMSPYEIKKRMKQIKEYYGNKEEYESFTFFPLFRTNYTMDDIANRVKSYLAVHTSIDVIVYDNFYSVFNGNGNDMAEVKAAINVLQSVSDYATIFLICHNNKAVSMNGGTKNALQGQSGSQAFGNYADEAMQINKLTDGVELVIEGRHTFPKKGITCLYGAENNFCFVYVDEYVSKDNENYSKPKEQLEKEYPELSKLIGDEGITPNELNKTYPDEDIHSMKAKGFWYSGRNKCNIKDEFKTNRFYLVDPRK